MTAIPPKMTDFGGGAVEVGLEWQDIRRDLSELIEMEITIQGKGYVIRTETSGVAGKVAQACGAALPPILRDA